MAAVQKILAACGRMWIIVSWVLFGSPLPATKKGKAKKATKKGKAKKAMKKGKARKAMKKGKALKAFMADHSVYDDDYAGLRFAEVEEELNKLQRRYEEDMRVVFRAFPALYELA